MNNKTQLTSEQEKFISDFSIGAFLGIWWALSSRIYGKALLYLIPLFNIFIWATGLWQGRRIVWNSGKWNNFDLYCKRQKLLDRIAIIILSILALIITLSIPFLFYIVFGFILFVLFIWVYAKIKNW